MLSNIATNIATTVSKAILSNLKGTFNEANETFANVLNRKIMNLPIGDNIIKSSKELNFLTLTVAKRYYTNEYKVKGPPTTEAWKMAVVEVLTQLIIRKGSLPSLEDCTNIAKQVREKMTSRLNTFMSENRRADSMEKREKRMDQVLSTLLNTYQGRTDQRFSRALEEVSPEHLQSQDEEEDEQRTPKRRRLASSRLFIKRMQVESLETCIDSDREEFVVIDSRIFYIKDR